MACTVMQLYAGLILLSLSKAILVKEYWYRLSYFIEISYQYLVIDGQGGRKGPPGSFPKTDDNGNAMFP